MSMQAIPNSCTRVCAKYYELLFTTSYAQVYSSEVTRHQCGQAISEMWGVYVPSSQYCKSMCYGHL